eukprot:GDKI01001079.1.p1 GENE.GDKI01001079.1~~GDKI01001079.1.p1  ORF type:complete len:429 (-),score=54.10 GDKI01001079.1:117-1403(-)
MQAVQGQGQLDPAALRALRNQEGLPADWKWKLSNGKEIPVHSFVMFAGSPVLRQMLGTECSEQKEKVLMVNFDEKTVELGLDAMYGLEMQLPATVEGREKLWEFANYYGMSHLQQMVDAAMAGHVKSLRARAQFDLFLHMTARPPATEAECVQGIAERFQFLAVIPEYRAKFMTVKWQDLKQIVEHERLTVDEVVLLRLLTEWCDHHSKHDPNDERGQAMAQVRLGLLSQEELLLHVKDHKYISPAHYLRTLEYHALPTRSPLAGTNQVQPREKPRASPWLVDTDGTTGAIAFLVRGPPSSPFVVDRAVDPAVQFIGKGSMAAYFEVTPMSRTGDNNAVTLGIKFKPVSDERTRSWTARDTEDFNRKITASLQVYSWVEGDFLAPVRVEQRVVDRENHVWEPVVLGASDPCISPDQFVYVKGRFDVFE